MKIVAFYLPQFHVIPENEDIWGEGFTEWTNVKKAIPLFEGHVQPVEPLNDNYYDLLDPKVMHWQAEMAKEYGIYGFCFYHYWIEGKKLLEKPIENFLKDEDINIHYCLSWANHSWTDAWKGSNKVFIEQTYGGKEDWNAHFEYLLPFFQDNRYIKIDNKPMFVIYMPEDIPHLNEMLDLWNDRARAAGFAGIAYAYQYTYFGMDPNKDDSRFDYGIEFQPAYAIADSRGKTMARIRKRGYYFLKWVQKTLNIRMTVNITRLEIMSYVQVWKYILNREPDDSKKIPGAFTRWDNTPRKGKAGLVIHGATPQMFQNYLSKQIQRAKKIYKKDFLFITAWNEWGEGCILEPTKQDGYAYLQAVKEALLENGELESD